MNNLNLLVLLFICMPISLLAQKNITTAGFQIKPIFQNDFLRTADKTLTVKNVDFTVGTKSGFAAGMVIRHGITNRFSIETGINYVKRNYDLTIEDTSFSSKTDFKIIGYEIPAMGMVFIKLSQNIHMNVSMGLSLDIFPSDIFTGEDYFDHFSLRHHIINTGVHSNLGWEYRTDKSGMIYFGASYHRPFEYIYFSQVVYEGVDPEPVISNRTLDGSYFTFDLRYFFPADPVSKGKKKKR